MPLARNFFTPDEQKRLVKAIEEAERHTSGEIRLHIENFCFGDGMKAARKLFASLRMHETKERNGVLIYIATLSHKVAIVGDEGIHAKLGTAFWEEMVARLIARFREHKQAEALAECIIECGRQLGTYFPRSGDDKDELSNAISY